MIRKACGTIFGIEMHALQDEPLCGLCQRRLAAEVLEAERLQPFPLRREMRSALSGWAEA